MKTIFRGLFLPISVLATTKNIKKEIDKLPEPGVLVLIGLLSLLMIYRLYDYVNKELNKGLNIKDIIIKLCISIIIFIFSFTIASVIVHYISSKI